MNAGSLLVYVGLDLVGDGLMKLPFLRALRANWPQARITWCAGKGSSAFSGPLAPLAAGLIDETIDDAGFGSRWSDVLRRPLPGRRFDLVIDTQHRVHTTLALRRVRHGRFVSAAAGFLFSDARPADRARPRALGAQLMQLVEAAGGDPRRATAPLALPAELRAAAAALLPAGPAYAGFAPGAGNPAKRWPVARHVEVASSLAGIATPVFVLGPDEGDLVEACRSVPGALLPLQDAAARGIPAGPALTIALAQRMAAAVASDSGGGHMLAAGECAMVSLFGPTDPAKFAPAARDLVVLRAQDFGAPGMQAIPSQAVRAALLAALARGRA